jgi:hypothetical protein
LSQQNTFNQAAQDMATDIANMSEAQRANIRGQDITNVLRANLSGNRNNAAARARSQGGGADNNGEVPVATVIVDDDGSSQEYFDP